MARFKVTIRREGKTERFQRDAIDTAVDVLEFELRALTMTSRSDGASGLGRRYEPGELVVVRGEIAGRGVRAGVDVLGDGTATAFTGRVRRQIVEPRDGESAYEALRRELMA